MSRSGYVDECEDDLQFGRWRGVVASSIRGKRGQAFLKEMLCAMDAMPDQRLIKNELAESDGVCAIGSVGKARGIDMSDIDPEDYDTVAGKFGIASPLAQEIVYMNDEAFDDLTPEQRFARMRKWIIKNIHDPAYRQRDDRDLVWC